MCTRLSEHSVMSYAQRWLLAIALLGQGGVQGEHIYMLNISSGGKQEPKKLAWSARDVGTALLKCYSHGTTLL